MDVYEPATGDYLGNARTDSSGNYTLTGLKTGDYKVFFSPGDAIHVEQWYDNKGDFAGADLVSVTESSETFGINASLEAGGSISGTVIDAIDGDVLSDCTVDAFDELNGNLVSTTWTDFDGNYTIEPLPAGNYKVFFHHFSDNYGSQWYSYKYH